MKDENIKEILDNLRYTAKKHTIQVLENGGKIEHCPQEIATELRLNSYNANILLDYITNLQEENRQTKLLKERYQLEKEVYKSRCEKALDKLYCYGEVFDSKILQEFQKEMENILQGEGKE